MRKYLFLLLVVVAAGLLGYYQLNPGEQAVVRTFGRASDPVTQTGPHWRIPFIQKVTTEKVDEIKRIELGFRTVNDASEGKKAEYVDVPEEALMLTADNQVAEVELVIQYKVADLVQYLFAARDREKLMRDTAESVLRQVVAQTELDSILTSGKNEVQMLVFNYLQRIYKDDYNLGIQVTGAQLQDVYPPEPVRAAFKSVTDALEEKQREINLAEAYKNERIPRARGEAAKLTTDAQAYKLTVLGQAKGETARFEQLQARYATSKEVTRNRLYMDMAEKVLSEADSIYVMEKGQAVPFIPLDKGVEGK